MTNSNDHLQEIIHRPVTFTNATLQKDTDELNKSLSQGYKVHDYVKTEAGIVYVLVKWITEPKKQSTRKFAKNNDLKKVYEDFLEEHK